MQKTPKPFRLSEDVIEILRVRAFELRTSQTAIVERALRELNQRLSIDSNAHMSIDSSNAKETTPNHAE